MLCTKCNREIRPCNFKRHDLVCDGTYFTGRHKPRKLLPVGDMTCQYCGKVCLTANSFKNHERTCPGNPNRIYKNGMTGKDPWNKGLDKSDLRVLEHSKAVSAALKGKAPAWEWTEERRKAKSEWRKKLHEEHPETHPNRRVAGNKNKWTKPERRAGDWLELNNIPYERNKKVDRFFPDFVVGNIIIEIDGAYWHNKEKDAERDLVLSGLGYIIYRIDANDIIEDRLQEILGVG